MNGSTAPHIPNVGAEWRLFSSLLEENCCRCPSDRKLGGSQGQSGCCREGNSLMTLPAV